MISKNIVPIGTSRTVGSAKKFVRITSGFELHFIYNNKLYMFLIVKAFATA
jgi:hypothetical protein